MKITKWFEDQPETIATIYVTKSELQFLLDVCEFISGDPKASRRGIADRFRAAAALPFPEMERRMLQGPVKDMSGDIHCDSKP